MLVADALDPVPSESIAQHCGTLKRFRRHHIDVGMLCPQKIAGGDSPRRTGGGYERRQLAVAVI